MRSPWLSKYSESFFKESALAKKTRSSLNSPGDRSILKKMKYFYNYKSIEVFLIRRNIFYNCNGNCKKSLSKEKKLVSSFLGCKSMTRSQIMAVSWTFSIFHFLRSWLLTTNILLCIWIKSLLKFVWEGPIFTLIPHPPPCASMCTPHCWQSEWFPSKTTVFSNSVVT